MSLKAMLWAMEEAPVSDPTSAMILMALGERADSDGKAAWPRHKEIASRARVSVSTVKRRLLELEERGLIRRGDQELVSHFPDSQRPIVWDLVLDGPQLTSEPGFNLNPGSNEPESDADPSSAVSYIPSFTSFSKEKEENRPSTGDSRRQAESRPEISILVNELGSTLKARGDKIPATPNDWLDHARLLIDRDKRDPDEALAVLRWSLAHHFWAPNIKSMKKFRAQYDTLRHQSEGDRGARSAAAQVDWDNL